MPLYTKYSVLTQANQLKTFWTWAPLSQCLTDLSGDPLPNDVVWEIKYPASIPGQWEVIIPETGELLALVYLSQEER